MAEPAAGFDLRRILLIAGVGVVLLFAMMFFLFRSCAARSQGGETLLYSNLDIKDAANVVARLKDLGIPYTMGDQGRSIMVAKAKVDDARIGLAEKNLPAGGVVGWEIFDETKLGATDFDRRIQLIRAISGELARTIRRIDAVEDVRVQIVLPETKLFAVETAPVTASVLLRLKPGSELSDDKINGIVHLVASSVENLQPQNVTIVDDFGRVLTAKKMVREEVREEVKEEVKVEVEEEVQATGEVVVTPEAMTVPMTTEISAEEKLLDIVESKKALENDLSGKAQEILNRFYPLNSAIVKVNVDLGPENEVNGLTGVILIDNRVELSTELRQSTYKAVAAAVGYDRNRGDKLILQQVPFHLASPPPEEVKQEVDKAMPQAKSESKPNPILVLLSKISLKTWAYIIGGLVVLMLINSIVGRFRNKPEPVNFGNRQSTPPAPVQPRTERPSALGAVKAAADQNPEKIAELLKKWLSE